MEPALVVAPRCPVCGDAIDEVPVSCERCDTAHHVECWEYVPGCAVFGCADRGDRPLSVEAWPETHRIVLEGVRWISWSGYGLQAVVVGFLAVVGTITYSGFPAIWAVGLFTGAVTATLASMFMAFQVKWALQRSGAFELLQAEAEVGDRRLARAIAERTGRTLDLPPSILALVASFLTLYPLLLMRSIGATDPDFVANSMPLVVTVYAALYGAIKLPTRWVGYQRVLANRLGAAIEAGRPVKQLGEPEG